jgi:GNAT superfamily N-acetyltransferase
VRSPAHLIQIRMLGGAGDGPVRGETGVDVSRHGFGEFGMLVDRDWRGRGAGSALVQATVEWAHQAVPARQR